jgi:hypothetical protein
MEPHPCRDCTALIFIAGARLGDHLDILLLVPGGDVLGRTMLEALCGFGHR